MKSILINFARAILKLAIFLMLIVLLVKPVAEAFIYMVDVDIKQMFLSGLPQFFGMLCKVILICAGMMLPYVVTNKIKDMRILSFVVGSALTALVYVIVQKLTVHIISLIAMMVTGILSMLLVCIIGTALFVGLLIWLMGPWGALLYLAYKEENKQR